MKLVLGTMTIGEQIFGEQAGALVQSFLSAGCRELDTAYVYNEGTCEQLLGEALGKLERNGYSLATKANPRITGRLDREAVVSQLNGSLERLGTGYVDIFYLHFPDPGTPLESALEGCAQLHSEGKFRELGLSNFPAWMVAEAHHICDKHGWVKPTVFQGLYNPLSRNAERELDMALDHYGMRFYAYNPLAGGILTDKYADGDRTVKAGRFTNRPNYQKRYWKDSYFEAANAIRAACAPYGISIVEASYRWLANHSMLKESRGDAILIGASRVSQLGENMAAARKGPLPEPVAAAFEAAWAISRPDAPEYFTLYVPKKG